MRSFERADIRALAFGDRVRVGFHYFNRETDVDAALVALREGMGRADRVPGRRQPQ